MQTWKELYLELADKLSEIEGIKWIDLWHYQISFLEDEHPFPAPAIFLSFSSRAIDDAGEKIQHVQLQVDAYLYYETMTDTYRDSINQESAIEFLKLLDSIQKTLHGTSGTNYSEMRRIAFSTVDSGNAGNLYVVNFLCHLIDNTASTIFEQLEADELDILNQPPGQAPEPENNFEVSF